MCEDYVKGYQAASKGEYHRDASSAMYAATALRDPDQTEVTDGVLRWRSNGNVPPEECCKLAVHLGVLRPEDLEKTNQARDDETAAMLARLKANPQPVSDEAMWEMRAAFGPGTEVVNVATGQRIRIPE